MSRSAKVSRGHARSMFDLPADSFPITNVNGELGWGPLMSADLAA